MLDKRCAIIPLTLLIGMWVPVAWGIGSTALSPLDNTPSSILLMESGTIDVAPNDNPANILETSKACPVNFFPYVTLLPSKVQGSTTSNQVLSDFAACTKSIGVNDTGAGYIVNYVTKRNYYDVDKNTKKLWVGTNKWAWTVWGSIEMPPSANLSNEKTDNKTVGGLVWTLYCYPPNQTPPSYDANCRA